VNSSGYRPWKDEVIATLYVKPSNEEERVKHQDPEYRPSSFLSPTSYSNDGRTSPESEKDENGGYGEEESSSEIDKSGEMGRTIYSVETLGYHNEDNNHDNDDNKGEQEDGDDDDEAVATVAGNQADSEQEDLDNKRSFGNGKSGPSSSSSSSSSSFKRRKIIPVTTTTTATSTATVNTATTLRNAKNKLPYALRGDRPHYKFEDYQPGSSYTDRVDSFIPQDESHPFLHRWKRQTLSKVRRIYLLFSSAEVIHHFV
jgi:hypothetical protein